EPGLEGDKINHCPSLTHWRLVSWRRPRMLKTLCAKSQAHGVERHPELHQWRRAKVHHSVGCWFAF
ncbi:MAG TPA: hypothetical protein VGP86_05865, partial [Xanthobacteraceae bacterium]|nr:hypothetical protein [Xanthobacteraceae bacterium]